MRTFEIDHNSPNRGPRKAFRKLFVIACFLCLALGCGLSALLLAQENLAKPAIPAADLEPTHFGVMLDAARVEGPMACAECHPSANSAWMESTHGASFNTRHRSKQARKIADRMGVRRFRAADSLCSACHTTQRQPDAMEETMAIAGPSCESCHGESEKWVHDHFDFGGAMTRMEETPEHREKRLGMLEKVGMVHPSKLFELGRRCYSCHVVSNASLVEIGGHPTGSSIDLVGWSQGEVRHNFVDSKGAENRESPLEHRREMLLIGATLEIEWGLRQLAKAEADGELFSEGSDRIDSAIKLLTRINKALGESSPKELGVFLKSVEKLDADALQALRGKPDEAGKAAESVLTEARKLATAIQMQTGKLEALDAFLPKAKDYQGKVWQAPQAAQD